MTRRADIVLVERGLFESRAKARAAAAMARLARSPEPFDAAEGRARFDAAFSGRWVA